MRLDRVSFNGYRSLAKSSCNVSPKVLALVGLNETGKSSALDGLNWLTSPDEPPLGSQDRYAGASPVSGPTVEVRLKLDPDEAEQAVRDLDTSDVPQYFLFGRTAAGDIQYDFEPAVRREVPELPELVALVQDGLNRVAEKRVGDSMQQKLGVAARELAGIAQSPDEQPEAADYSNLMAVAQFAAQNRVHPNGDNVLPVEKQPNPAYSAIAPNLLDSVAALTKRLADKHPVVAAGDRMRERMPRFLKFSDDARELPHSIEFRDDASWASIPRALENLLAVAGSSAEQLRGALESPETHVRARWERRCNDTLAKAMPIVWRSREVALEFRTTGRRVEIMATERKPGDPTSSEHVPLNWRSEGLRSFAALKSFLMANNADESTILLIDEPEAHLHYSAQALLVELLEGLAIHKVIFATHSPGCLPRDLGTGIRVAQHVAPQTSELKNNFWGTDDVGFNTLLFAMGAEGAAFSATRILLACEGESEMALLPSLLRAALGTPAISYPVGFGIAQTPLERVGELDSLAGTVAYLVDGDEGGNVHKDKLLAWGVEEERIKSLPTGIALEDLLTWDLYKAALVEVARPDLAERIRAFTENDLPTPRATSLAGLVGKSSAPGKPIVAATAAMLMGELADPASALTQGAIETLRAIDAHVRAVAETAKIQLP